MIGDKLIIKDEHRKAGQGIMEVIFPGIQKSKAVFTVSIAGESGAGKSEVAVALADKLAQKGIRSVILQQDDYFIYPPYTNDRMRRKDIKHVGPDTEVKLDLMDRNIKDIVEGKKEIEKPLVIYEDDRIDTETINTQGVRVVIAEGTYTTLLKNLDARVFIDRIYTDTKAARLERAREEQDDFLEKVLKIEHDIISAHKKKAQMVLTRDYDVEVINGA